MLNIGEFIERERERNDLSRKDVYQRLGISKQRYGQYANGVRKPDYEMLARMCDLFNCSADALLGREVQNDEVKHILRLKMNSLSEESLMKLMEYTDFLAFRERIAESLGGRNRRSASEQDT